MIKIKLIGSQKFRDMARRIFGFRKMIEDGILKEAHNFGLRTVATSKEKYLSGPRPERLGVVTGRLRASMTYKVLQENKMYRIIVGTDVPYGQYHEHGTDKIRARPFLSPAVEDNIDLLQEKLYSVLARAAGK